LLTVCVSRSRLDRVTDGQVKAELEHCASQLALRLIRLYRRLLTITDRSQ